MFIASPFRLNTAYFIENSIVYGSVFAKIRPPIQTVACGRSDPDSLINGLDSRPTNGLKPNGTYIGLDVCLTAMDANKFTEKTPSK